MATVWLLRPQDQQHASGEPYFSHTITVTEILAAAMLHDAIEDAPIMLTPAD
jgi:(p)ppGpp synthase/HD superfamily hydrolase